MRERLRGGTLADKVFKDPKTGEWVIVPPKNEYIWMIGFTKGRIPEYFITSKSIRDVYYLYGVNGNNYERLYKGESPLEMEEKFRNRKR